jgi:hypothetical protein
MFNKLFFIYENTRSCWGGCTWEFLKIGLWFVINDKRNINNRSFWHSFLENNQNQLIFENFQISKYFLKIYHFSMKYLTFHIIKQCPAPQRDYIAKSSFYTPQRQEGIFKYIALSLNSFFSSLRISTSSSSASTRLLFWTTIQRHLILLSSFFWAQSWENSE